MTFKKGDLVTVEAGRKGGARGMVEKSKSSSN